MKVQVVLPRRRETPNAVVYAAKKPETMPVGQVYVRKDNLEKIGDAWPDKVTVTVEPGDTTEG